MSILTRGLTKLAFGSSCTPLRVKTRHLEAEFKMLKQILREMYIDPEILAGLDETQKQTLFCKMREEQIRRWRIWDQKYEQNLETIEQNKLNKKSDKRSVSFRTGDDGDVWVWVMGEHPDDKTIEEILADEAKREARELAEIETKEFRRSYVAEFSEIIDYDSDCSINKIDNVELLDTPKIDDMEIYCSVDELRDRLNKTNSSIKTTPKISSFTQNNMYSSRIPNYNLSSINNVDKVDNLKDSVQKPSQKVSAKIALWEKRVINEKTNEIYRRIQKKQQESVKEAEEAARKQEELWQEQEKKSKEAECQMRAIARRAREEHRKSMTTEQLNEFSNDTNSPLANSSPPSSLDSNMSKPPSQDAVVKWYRDEEFPKGCGINSEDGKPFQWFHGLVTRLDAEDLLSDEPRGTFLVRVSEKIWGYAISYKDTDRCKHYLVDTSSGTYQFLGANQLTHKSLNDLIFYHAHVPITMSGNELLLESRVPTSDCPKLLDGLL